MGVVSVRSPYGMLAVRKITANTTRHFLLKGGVAREMIAVHVQGELGELSGGNENLFYNVPSIENLVSRQVSREVSQTLASLQEKKLDPIGLALPYVWRNPHLFHGEASPRTFYTHMHISVRATTSLSNLGGKT